MTDKIVTTKYKREKQSKGLVSTDVAALKKHEKQKSIQKQLESANKEIAKISAQMKEMQALIQKHLEQNK